MVENINAKNLKGIPPAILAKLLNQTYPMTGAELLALLQGCELTPRVHDFKTRYPFDLKAALHMAKKAVQDTKSGLDPARL